MKTQLCRLVLCSTVMYLICLNLPVLSASPRNETHLCGFSEQQSINRRYARTFANLEVGVPRTVRLVYFLPVDRPSRGGIEEKMDALVRDVREFYADQMEYHGFGRRTFGIETDYVGKAVVHRVNGQFVDSYYHDGTFRKVWREIHQRFDTSQNIYLAVVDVSSEQIGTAAGVASTNGDSGGFAAIPASGRFFNHPLAAHELGHTFGLKHDFRASEHIMSYGPWAWGQTTKLSQCAAKWLRIQRYFNPAISIRAWNTPTIELVSPHTYPAGSESVSIQLRVADFEGLHQVLLIGTDGLRSCHEFEGQNQDLVEFDYDGDFTLRGFASLADRAVHPIRAVVVDTDGNVSDTAFNLFPETLQALTKVSGDNQPRGLANTPLPIPFIVELRDVNDGSARRGVWVAFSVTAGGGTLSTTGVFTDPNGRAESTLTLGPSLGTNTVDVSALEFTVTFNAMAGLPVEIPDASLRAVVEKTLKKVSAEPISQAEMATLIYTEPGTWSVGISDLTGLEFAVNFTHLDLSHNTISDISLLASLTNLEQLVLRGNSISDLSPLSELTNLTLLVLENNAVSDISEIASLTGLTRLALGHNTISDIMPLMELTNLKLLFLEANRISDISSLAGLTNLRALQLASNNISDLAPLVSNMGLGDGDEIGLREILLSYPSIHAHIPTLQARGVEIFFDDRTPARLDPISGDNQSGVPGAALPNPFVVEVKDENGLTFEGVPVTFAVTAGGGSLNPPNITTEFNGRAESTFTLGQKSGTNTVRVSAEGISQSLTFSAEGIRVAQELSKISGDDQVGFPGETLPSPLVVEVRDQSDKPLRDVQVTFAVIAGGGTLTVTTTNTDSTGRSESQLTLGPNAGTNTVSVSASGIDGSELFNAEGVRTPQKIVIISGDSQEGLPGGTLTDPLVVEVRDKNGAPLGVVAITFTVTAGDGTLRLTSTETASNGRAESTFTLGTSPGIHTVEVSAAGVEDPAVFSAVVKRREFVLSIPRGSSLIHIPLRVTAVNEEAATIESVGDLYDALGGADTVNLLTTRNPKTQQWHSYIGDSSGGNLADPQLTDDKGIIASMRLPVELRLAGDPLGKDGNSAITLQPGTNVVGVPLRDSRIMHVSDLLALEGIRDNVPTVTVSVNGKFKVVERAGDDGDIPITGGQSFIMVARSEATIAISGDGWGGLSDVEAAPQLALTGIYVPNATPILCLTGSILYETGDRERDLPLAGSALRLTVQNPATGKAVTTLVTTGDAMKSENAGYQLTVVETASGRAAQVGDVLEVSAETSNPLIRVRSLRYTVTAADVRNSRILLPELVAYEIPTETALLPNYPNPFNPETWIPYRLAEDADVTLTIYDTKGVTVRRLDLGHQLAGYYADRGKAAYWDGRNNQGESVASGLYFYQLATPSFRQLRRMVILK